MPFLGKTPTKFLDANVNIDGGNIDGTTIGATSAASATVTTFTSTGIDDNATSTAITIDSSENVGIGTTSPASLLDIQGAGGATTSPTVTATTGTNYIGWKSANTGGSFWTAIDNSTGSAFGTGTAYARVFWGGGAYPFVFSPNGTERVRISSTGNVGIGTTSPSKKLHVSALGSSAQIMLESTNATNGQIIFKNASTTNNFYVGLLGDSSGDAMLYHGDAKNMGFWTNATERMRIDSSGRVGIGVSGPQRTLHINGGATRTDVQLTLDGYGETNADGVQFGILTTGSYIWNFENTPLYFATNNTERMRIDSSGNVGIGTSSPGTTLTVNADPPSATYGIANFTAPVGNDAYIVVNRGSADNGGFKVQRGSNVDGAFYVTGGEAVAIGYNMSDTGDSLLFRNGSSNAEVARMDNSGNLLVGRTSISGINTGTGFQVQSDGIIQNRRDVNGGSSVAQFYGNAGSAQIKGDGDLENTNNSYGAISDERLKSNIVDASSQIDDIMAVQVRSYTLNETGETHIGVVAQELEASGMSGLVKTDNEGMKAVKYSVLYMKAIKALQEAVTRIETLEAEVAALKGA